MVSGESKSSFIWPAKSVNLSTNKVFDFACENDWSVSYWTCIKARSFARDHTTALLSVTSPLAIPSVITRLLLLSLFCAATILYNDPILFINKINIVIIAAVTIKIVFGLLSDISKLDNYSIF